MGNFITVGSLFFISLIIFHALLLLKRIRQSGVFWHAVDYLWLLTAAVALAFATVEVHKLRVKSYADELRSDARKQLNVTRHDTYEIWVAFQDTRDRDGGRKGNDWLKKVSDELELGVDNFRWEIFLIENEDLIDPKSRTVYSYNPIWESYRLDPQLTDPKVIEEAKYILLQLKMLSDMKSAALKREAELKSSETERKMKFMWPWFLCLALAIRMTKVTADLLRYRESNRKLATKNGPEEHVAQSEPLVKSDAP